LGALLGHVREVLVAIRADGTITFASPSIRGLLGYDPEAVIGRNLLEFLHPDELDEIVESIARWVGRDGTPRGQRQRARTSAGDWMAIEYEVIAGEAVVPFGDIVMTLRRDHEADPTDAERRQMLHNEDRLVRLASVFLHIPVERFEDGLDEAIAELAGLEWVTRVSAWRAAGDRVTRRAVWEAPRNAPTISLPDRLRIDDWRFLRRLAAGEEVHIRSASHLPDDWEEERSWMVGGGVRSSLSVPMLAGGVFTGFVMAEVTLGDIAFDATHLTTVRSAAAILAEAFARHDVELELARRAQCDALTGLPNRWAFAERLGDALALAEAGSAAGVGVALVDLDRFKLVNDAFGHRCGDRLFAEVAQRFEQAAGESAVVGRLGGDELLVLHPDVGSLDDAVANTRSLVEVLEAPFEVEGEPVVLTASVGVAFAPDLDGGGDELVRRAEVAMYRAKQAGGHRLTAEEPGPDGEVARRLRREAELRDAVERDGLDVYFQGEWDLDGESLVGAEALARWTHPADGLLEAGTFIPMAEECGVIEQLGVQVLRRSCQALARWRAAGLPDDFVVRVNLSAHQLRQPDLVEVVVEALVDADVPAASLCLELTESALLVDPARATAVLGRLRELGVGLAVDDFGTGFSSLVYLKRLPLTSLKIDRSFVSGLPDDASDAAIVEAVVGLARSLGVSITAEGVETGEQRAALVAMGCRRAQGFLLSRPEPEADFAARLLA
jgi:diguanylate cyclase (GGDEF)-like protein/PAS domain S-box-containing protein